MSDGDLTRRVELAGALPLPFGELPQQVLVGPAQDVRLDVVEAEPVVRVAQHLDEGGEPAVVHDRCPAVVALKSVTSMTPGEPRVLAGHGPHGVGEVFTQASGLAGNGRPARRLGDVEADELVVLLDELGGGLLRRRSRGPGGRSRRRTRPRAASGRRAAGCSP